MTSASRLVAIAVDHPDVFQRATRLARKGRVGVLHAPATGLLEHHADYDHLSAVEKARYQSFRSPLAAMEFRAGRLLMRAVYANWFSCASRNIEITSQPHEKPQLLSFGSEGLDTQPQLNLSHSAGHIALAVHQSQPIGLDIELSKASEADCREGLDQIFTQEEIIYLCACLDQAEANYRFLTLWRAKEAIMKATGLGFSLPPNSFTVLDQNGTVSKRVVVENRTWYLDRLPLTQSIDAACAWADH